MKSQEISAIEHVKQSDKSQVTAVYKKEWAKSLLLNLTESERDVWL